MNKTTTFCLAFATLEMLLNPPEASFGVMVLDERTRKPLTGIEVGWSVMKSNGWNGGTFDGAMVRTDERGLVWAKGKTAYADAGYFIPDVPKGYYGFIGENFRYEDYEGVLLKRWLPYGNIHTVLLQRVEHPIPLYVKDVVVSNGMDLTTGPDRRFSYDLVKGDWMPPFGKGETADVEFQVLDRKVFGMVKGASGKVKPWFRDTMSVCLVGTGNGMVETVVGNSLVVKIREAPLDGYENSYLMWDGVDNRLQWERSFCRQRCFAFRIRTAFDETGQVRSGYYGKIYGDFTMKFGSYSKGKVASVVGVEFTYYLNPTPNDRNLEYDGKHNLNKANWMKEYAP